MAKSEMLKKIELLNEYEALLEELKAEADEIKNEIKAEMEANGLEEMQVDQYIVRFTSVLSSRFDTKRFKETFGEEMYNAFTKQVSSRRFSIA